MSWTPGGGSWQRGTIGPLMAKRAALRPSDLVKDRCARHAAGRRHRSPGDRGRQAVEAALGGDKTNLTENLNVGENDRGIASRWRMRQPFGRPPESQSRAGHPRPRRGGLLARVARSSGRHDDRVVSAALGRRPGSGRCADRAMTRTWRRAGRRESWWSYLTTRHHVSGRCPIREVSRGWATVDQRATQCSGG